MKITLSEKDVGEITRTLMDDCAGNRMFFDEEEGDTLEGLLKAVGKGERSECWCSGGQEVFVNIEVLADEGTLLSNILLAKSESELECVASSRNEMIAALQYEDLYGRACEALALATKRVAENPPAGEWVDIGMVAVESGQITIGDPCYLRMRSQETLNVREDPEHGAWTLSSPVIPGERTGEPLALTFMPGVGDGSYRVQARYKDEGDWGRRIAEVRIRCL